MFYFSASQPTTVYYCSMACYDFFLMQFEKVGFPFFKKNTTLKSIFKKNY